MLLSAPLTLHNGLPVPAEVSLSAWGKPHRLLLQPNQRATLHAVDAPHVEHVMLRALGYHPTRPLDLCRRQLLAAGAARALVLLGEPLDENRVGVSLDWLPWHHTWGGNAVLGSMVRIAGSLFIDGGRPVEGRFQETLENLRELSPTSFASVPAAFPLLLDALEKDADLRAKFFACVPDRDRATQLFAALAHLDEVEGAVAGDYRRVEVVTESGRTVWAYEYGGGLTVDPIEDGSWLAHLERLAAS